MKLSRFWWNQPSKRRNQSYELQKQQKCLTSSHSHWSRRLLASFEFSAKINIWILTS